MERLAIFGGEKAKTKEFPIWPHSDSKEIELLTDVVNSRKWWRMNGHMVEDFENKFAALHNVNYALAVTSGTHAIELALTTLGIGKGDEVIVPSITFISTCTAVIYCDAVPVLADVDRDTYCMTPESFEKAITSKTKAVVPVHMAGHSCDMKKIREIAKKHNIWVVEDAAHAHGGECYGHKIGYYSDMAIFSFQNGKIMTCGEGGAIITNNKELYEKAFLVHGVGRPKNDKVYEHSVLGSNYRMNEFQGAILNAQIERLEGMNKLRDANAHVLDKLLSDVDGIVPQKQKDYVTLNTHYMYMFYYDEKKFDNLSRTDFVKYLNAEGIPAFICFPVLSDTTFFKNNAFNGRINPYDKSNEQDLNISRDLAGNVVWLPHNTLLGDQKDLEEIYLAIKKIQTCCNIK